MTPAAAILGLDLRTLVVVAGAGQLLLALSSLAIPRVLGWRAELRALTPMTRQVFWTYAAYIYGSHVAFGLASLLLPDRLVDGSPLSRAVCGFIALWWTARLVVALVGCEGRELPRVAAVRVAERILQVAFLALASGYGFVAIAGAAAVA